MDPDAKEEMKASKVNQGLEMLDKVLRVTESGVYKKVSGAWRAVVSL